ncbi:MAG: lytic transglycosylase protein [Devosia sp.]|nr:lytic transglycosylase protein [Devosia sp.]
MKLSRLGQIALVVNCGMLLTGAVVASRLPFSATNPTVDALITSSIARIDPVSASSSAAIMSSSGPVVASVKSVVPLADWQLFPSTAKVEVSAPTIPPVQSATAEFRAALALIGTSDYSDAFAAAAELSSSVERHAIEWLAIEGGGTAIGYRDIERFVADAGSFADPALLQLRLEQAVLRAKPAASEMVSALADGPTTIEGQFALAKALQSSGDAEAAAKVVKSLWIDNFLDEATEKRVLAAFGDMLTREDHWARAVHLMMHDRAKASERLLSFLTEAQESLVVARAAVSRDAKNAKALLDKVDVTLQTNPVYLFSRVQRARQAGLLESAVDWLGKATGPMPDAAEWWYERRTIVRALLGKGEPELAYAAADGFVDGPEGRQVEAHFHAGWIALTFLKDAEAAQRHFSAMAKLATMPDTVTQANYWLGRAETALGDREAAVAAFTAAKRYPTVYYGQLALAELGEKLTLRDVPSVEASEASFEKLEPIRAVRLLAGTGQRSKALILLRNFARTLEDGAMLALSARLAEKLGAHDVSISIAETAEAAGWPLDGFSFPSDTLPDDERIAEIDTAAVYAVTRQESRFRVDAVSSAGARGLMQLMPGTAKETAERLGLEYSSSRLISDASYNALLGATYLARQLSYYDGSLLLAAAAYNAGAGNANDWIDAYGDPRDASVDPVVWVELIPFQETRKYVQRVLGNYLVYRARFGSTVAPMTEVLRTIQ